MKCSRFEGLKQAETDTFTPRYQDVWGRGGLQPHVLTLLLDGVGVGVGFRLYSQGKSPPHLIKQGHYFM